MRRRIEPRGGGDELVFVPPPAPTRRLSCADTIVPGLPLYNFGPPSAVKAWVDHLIASGLSIDPETQTGVLGGRDFLVRAARGGGYQAGTPRHGWDHAEPWLPHGVSYTGLEPRFIAAELTLAESVPAMAHLRSLAADSLAAAERQIDEQWDEPGRGRGLAERRQSMDTHLIIGGTGKVGGRVADDLRNAGRPVRVAPGTEGIFIPRDDTVTAPVGDGLEPFIDVADIAAVAAATLTGDHHDGETIDLSGPEAMTFAEAVAVVGEQAGRNLRFEAADPGDFAREMSKAGMTDLYVAWRMAMFEGIRDGRDAFLSDGVERVLGRPATTFAAWAAREAPSLRDPASRP
jgi:hypothetical protein